MGWSNTRTGRGACRERSGQDEHGVAEAVEAVAFGNGLAVGLEREFGAGEGADQHEECRTGKVEVRDEDVDDAEGIAGEDAQFGPAFVGLDAAAFGGDMFERADDGGPDGDDSPAGRTGGLDRGGRLGRDGDVFGVEVVLARVFDLDGPERAGAYFEGHARAFDAGFIERTEEFGGEVEAGGRGSGAPRKAAIDGLVAFGVAVVVSDVGRKGNGADRCGVESTVEFEDHRAFGALDDGGGEGTAGGPELEHPAGDGLAGGTEEYLPSAVREGTDEECFDCAAGSRADAEEAGGHDAGVVDDHEVAGLEQAGKVLEDVVGDSAGGAVEDEEACGIARFGRLLGDQFAGEFEVEVAGAHCCEHCAFVEPGLG